MLQSGAFHFPFALGRINEETAEQCGGVIDRWHVHACTGPAHVCALLDAGINRRKTRGTADMLSGDLVERDILCRKAGGLLLLDAGEKSLNRPVPAVEFVIQMRKHRQIIAMLLEWLQGGGGRVALAGVLGKKLPG